MTPLDKARELILSLTTPEEAKAEIERLSACNSTELSPQLTALYNTAEEKATAGDTKAISLMLRVLEHFGDKSHDRMLLHYIAQAEANKALKIAEEQKNPQLQEALQLISSAFADADDINDAASIK